MNNRYFIVYIADLSHQLQFREIDNNTFGDIIKTRQENILQFNPIVGHFEKTKCYFTEDMFNTLRKEGKIGVNDNYYQLHEVRDTYKDGDKFTHIYLKRMVSSDDIKIDMVNFVDVITKADDYVKDVLYNLKRERSENLALKEKSNFWFMWFCILLCSMTFAALAILFSGGLVK